MIIDHQLLSPASLEGLIESFVSREGTDYGEVEVSLADKTAEVKRQLDNGEALILYDEKTESATVMPTHQVTLILGKDKVKVAGV